MVKVFLATPCYGGLALERYVTSVVKLQLLLMRKGIQLFIDTTENESLVHRARNVSLGRFMQKTDADLLFFVDADVEFDAESALRLIESTQVYDIACACYPKKVIQYKQAADAVRSGDERPMSMLASSLVVNIGAQRRSVENGFIEVLDAPTGFLCVHRRVFEKLEKDMPELWCQNDHQNRDFDSYHAAFDTMIDPETKRYLSEDYAFSRRAQMAGFKVMAHCGTTLGHVGNLPFNGILKKRLKALETV